MSCMHTAMAGFAKCHSVRDNESQTRLQGEVFDMMSMKVAGLSTRTALVAIAPEDGVPPYFQLIAEPSPFSIERPTVFVSIAPCAFASACLRTKDLGIVISAEGCFASRTGLYPWLMTLAPALLAAPSSIAPVRMNLKGGTASLAYLLHFRLSGHHKAILPQIEPRYVDVSIRRWEAYTGQKAVLEG